MHTFKNLSLFFKFCKKCWIVSIFQRFQSFLEVGIIGSIFRIVLAEDGYTLEAVLGSDVLHPVDSYNLIKRTARTWSKILASLSLSEETVRTAVEEARTNFPLWETSRVPVALGILNIHVYYRQTQADTRCSNVTYRYYDRRGAENLLRK